MSTPRPGEGGRGAPFDLLVVGGGPVGAVTAVEAARAGLRVALVEPRRPPIDKACGEGVMPSGLAHLQRLGIAPEGSPIRGIRYVDPARGREVRAGFRGGRSGLGVRRTTLQLACHEAALAHGVEWLRDAVSELDTGGEHATEVGAALRSGGTVRARWVVGADGLHSGVRRHVSPAVHRSRAPARYGLVRHHRGVPAPDHVSVHWTRLGEVYVTPLAADEVGVAVLTSPGTAHDDVVALAPEVRDLVGAGEPTSMRGAGPLWQVPRRRTRGRVLLVGDAAGYLDALTGEGISVGLAQAQAAVAAVLAGDLSRYERSWWRVSGLPFALTGGLAVATRSDAVRSRLVPLATRARPVFGAAVSLAGG